MTTKFHTYFLLLLIVGFISCTRQALQLPPKSENNLNLNSLLTLPIGKDTLHTQDFIAEPRAIDSVVAEGVRCELLSKKHLLSVTLDEASPTFFTITLWSQGVPYAIPCRKTNHIGYTFRFDPKGKVYSKVQIAGQMNDWLPTHSPELHLNEEGVYEAELLLSPGTYLYQMVLDGEWNHDPNNPHKVDNGYGKFNSILQIEGEADKKPTLTTWQQDSKRLTLKTTQQATEVHAYWQNYQLPSSFIQLDGDNISIDIPQEATSVERSYIRVWGSNAYGVSNDILIPLHKGRVLTKSQQLNRHDLHAQIIYFILVDRFNNGDTTNDQPMNRPDVHPKVDYYGGDIAGIKQVMESGYFERLGVNTLWVSPLNQNPYEPYGWYAPQKTKFSSYHGYWPISSHQVDRRFGDKQSLKALVQQAHRQEMNVLLDYVAHHVHEAHPLFQKHPDYFTPLHLPDGTLNTERWNEHRLTTWFDTFIPTFDMSNPTVVDMMTDSAMYWVNEFELDGFRHDACKHVPTHFWRELTRKIKSNNQGKNLYQIGETYGSPALINSYLTTGMLDGQFDFNVFDEASTTLAGVGVPDMQRVMNVLQTSFDTYGYHNLMGYISGNHDKPRFMAYASGDLQFGEDSKAAGWERNIGVTDSIAYQRMALLQTFIMTIPGVPVIFYGDEIGMTGANDPDCRRMMRFDAWSEKEETLFEQVQTLAHLRKDHPVLVYGDFINLATTSSYTLYARQYFDKVSIVAINNGAETTTITVDVSQLHVKEALKSTFGNAFDLTNQQLTITLPPFSAEVLL